MDCSASRSAFACPCSSARVHPGRGSRSWLMSSCANSCFVITEASRRAGMPPVAAAAEGQTGAGKVARGDEPHWILDGTGRTASTACSRSASRCCGRTMRRLKSSQGLPATGGVRVR
eukprot:11844645-Alexandrium_andersonii.AAC.1